MWEVIIAGLCLLVVLICLSQGIMKCLPEPATEEQALKNLITISNVLAFSIGFGQIYCFLNADTGYFVLYLFFCQSIYVGVVQILKKHMDKNNNENAESVKNHICAFQALQQKYETLMAKSSKLEKEHTTLQQNHDKLIAESNKLVNGSKTLHSDVKGKSPSKRKVRSDKVSPRTVDINLSRPCQEPQTSIGTMCFFQGRG